MPLITLILLMFFYSVNVGATELTCPDGTANVFIESGRLPISNAMIGTQQDIGGDYDEDAPQVEWNFLNQSPDTTPSLAHCYLTEDEKQMVDVPIPEEIKRCILRGKKFLCKSGTIACAGYVDFVTIVEKAADGTTKDVPATEQSKDNKRKIWKQLDQGRTGPREALCSDTYFPDQKYVLSIPEDMKECAFVDRRFRCTATPDQHDWFWP